MPGNKSGTFSKYDENVPAEHPNSDYQGTENMNSTKDWFGFQGEQGQVGEAHRMSFDARL